MFSKIKFDVSLIVNIACGIILAGIIGHVVLLAAFALGIQPHENDGKYSKRGEKNFMNRNSMMNTEGDIVPLGVEDDSGKAY